MVPLDDQQIERLLATLLPRHDLGELIMALRAAGPLGALRERIVDLVLLALVYPLSGLPASPLALYDHAQALVLPVLRREAAPVQRDEETRAALVLPMLPIPGEVALRHYEAALHLATLDESATVAALEEQGSLLPLLAALAPDPSALYAHAWGSGTPAAATLLMLARCVAQRPGSAPLWGRRLAVTLAQESDDEQIGIARQLIEPVLPLLLDARDAQSFALFADTAWPSSRVLLTLLDDTALLASLRWAAADALCRRVPPLRLLTVEDRVHHAGLRRPGISESDTSDQRRSTSAGTTLDVLSRAARAYIIATAMPEEHRQLAQPEARSWVRALLGEGIDSARRSAALAALVDNDAAPEALRVLLLPYLALRRNASDTALLARACRDPSPEVRAAALTALAALPPAIALRLMAHLIADPPPVPAILEDWLLALARMPQGEASALLVRSVLDGRLPLDVRHQALKLLARRRQAATLVLPRLLAAETLDPVLRAAACQVSIQLDADIIFKPIHHLALHCKLPLLRRAAVQACAAFADDACYADAVTATMLHVLDTPTIDDVLLGSAVRALGHRTSTAALAALGNLLRRGRSHELRTAWLAQSADFALLAPARWDTLPLAEETRVVLAAHMASGVTAADPPGSLEELVANQDELLRGEAAHILVRLAAADAMTRLGVRADLRQALCATPTPALARKLLAALAALSEDHGASELAECLTNPALDVGTRWLAIACLGAQPAVLPSMVRYLEAGKLDVFNAGQLIAAVGGHASVEALPALRRLADNHTLELYLRICAVKALGMLEAAAVAILMPIGSDTTAPIALRAAAIEALPEVLDASVRRTLRDMLRQDRQQTELVTAAARCLGRAGDREALPLLLRYAQSERSDEALAAIEALVTIGDATIVPVLVHVSQSAVVPGAVRLRAVEALLQLGGDEYLPLLQSYLDSRQPSLREQAYAVLAAHDRHDVRLRTPLADPDAPLALRLQAITVLAAEQAQRPLLLAILEASDEPLQLRLLAATALAHPIDGATRQRLFELVIAAETPPLLARRCFDVLVEGDDAVARSMLYAIAATPTVPVERGFWASEAIVQLK
jgi:HEAT repeat protein